MGGGELAIISAANLYLTSSDKVPHCQGGGGGGGGRPPPPLSLVFEYMEGDSFPPFYWGGGGGETDKNLKSRLRGGAVWATELSRVWCRLKGAGLIINPSIHVRRTVGRGGGWEEGSDTSLLICKGVAGE